MQSPNSQMTLEQPGYELRGSTELQLVELCQLKKICV